VNTNHYRHPIVVLAGMPAAGKSTLSKFLVRHLAETWSPVEISLDDALEVQCPLGRAEFSSHLMYERDQRSFMLADDWRPEQMRLATYGVFSLMRMADRVLGEAPGQRFFLLEFPLTELSAVVSRVREFDIENCILVLLSAGKSVCIDRNLHRTGNAEVPGSVMEYFYRALDSVDVATECERLAALGWHIFQHNTEGPLDEVVPRVGEAVAHAVESYF
jgi:hypothetical protein